MRVWHSSGGTEGWRESDAEAEAEAEAEDEADMRDTGDESSEKEAKERPWKDESCVLLAESGGAISESPEATEKTLAACFPAEFGVTMSSESGSGDLPLLPPWRRKEEGVPGLDEGGEVRGEAVTDREPSDAEDGEEKEASDSESARAIAAWTPAAAA